MKVIYNFNKMSVEFESDTVKEVFAQLSSFQEVFGEKACGKCGSCVERLEAFENSKMEDPIGYE